ncbi:WKF domain-containing protein [Aspergillus thermomutatus]|uniref:WKF domain-containing protein n=1 Tax=Aspergillus thermomutatus TaxID=41047 RepID=A0A397HUM2_ASPTH|nr:uncharacterized protein CDV56_109444 [Aspergillus thermomutatus]RHZ66915.1 hypothetical protein CDV56_109444 [Aspergillus thermomutatus]
MSSEESAQSSHVSASKKASRKLKHAKDTPAVDYGEDNEVDKKDKKTKDKKKKKKSSDGQSSEDGAVTTDIGEKKQMQREKKSKKRRLDDENGGEEKAVVEAESESQQRRKKKRVSFSADTVMRDGEESQSESRPGVQDDSKINGDAEEGQASLANVEKDDADDEGAKKKKKEKKKKKKDQSVTTASNTSPTAHETPILSYLDLYHKHRSAWKFQKNRETHLFKHILSLEHVPAKYNAALLSYLHGLKSEGAKQRLRQIAEEVVKAEMEEDLTKEQAAETEDKADSDMTGYKSAVEAFRTRLSQGKDDFDEIEAPESLDGEQLKKLQRRQRAELVLFAVSGKLFYLERTKAKRGPSTQAPPAKKKKKNRTAFVEISSSSESESASDSDSDSDSEKKPKKAAKPKKDSSSESSSTDSSSDSDDNDSHKRKATRKKEASSSGSSSDSSTDSSSDSDSD